MEVYLVYHISNGGKIEVKATDVNDAIDKVAFDIVPEWVTYRSDLGAIQIS